MSPITTTKGFLHQALNIPDSGGSIPIAEIIRQLSRGQILTTSLFRPLSKAKISSLECCRFGNIPDSKFWLWKVAEIIMLLESDLWKVAE